MRRTTTRTRAFSPTPGATEEPSGGVEARRRVVAAANRRLAWLVLRAGAVQAPFVAECLRACTPEAPTVDRVLFQRGLLTAAQVRALQAEAGLLLATCPGCRAIHDLAGVAPGAARACACGAAVIVPGLDRDDPFRPVPAPRRAPRAAAPGWLARLARWVARAA